MKESLWNSDISIKNKSSSSKGNFCIIQMSLYVSSWLCNTSVSNQFIKDSHKESKASYEFHFLILIHQSLSKNIWTSRLVAPFRCIHMFNLNLRYTFSELSNSKPWDLLLYHIANMKLVCQGMSIESDTSVFLYRRLHKRDS